MSIIKTLVFALVLFFSIGAFAQGITVTVAEKLPFTVESLDFTTTLDEASLNFLKKSGLMVDVNGTYSSPNGTSYKCTIKSVTKEQYEGLEDGWKIRLSMANSKVRESEYQNEFLAGLYEQLLQEAMNKAKPLALAMQKELTGVDHIELKEYYSKANPNSVHPYDQDFFAKLEVVYGCK